MKALEKYTVFLGGTCNESTWRAKLIPELEKLGIKYFNPVVEDWAPACQEAENVVKNHPDTINLFVITSEMIGVYSIAEAVDSSNKKPNKTIFQFLPEGFNKAQIKSLRAVVDLIDNNKAVVVPSNTSMIRLSKIIYQIIGIRGIKTSENEHHWD